MSRACCSLVRSQRLRARLILAGLAATVVFLVAVTLSPLKSGFADHADRGPGDIQLYDAEVSRIHAGEHYYDAAEAELTARGYPTRSAFNWRTPLPVWLIGKAPDRSLAKALLGAAALVLVVLSFQLLATEGGPRQAYAGMLCLVGALLPCLLGNLFVLPELWAGVLVALSAVALAQGRERLGFAAALASLFLRELSGLYYLVCMAFAVRERRWRELAAWLIGLAAYAAFYAVHLEQVLPRITADSLSHQGTWLRFGGAGFLISTVQMNAFLLLLPQWVTAIYLAFALVGCAGWNSPAGRRIVIPLCAYLAAFCVVGYDFNQYWGSMIAPLLALSVGRFLVELGRLWNEAKSPSGQALAAANGGR